MFKFGGHLFKFPFLFILIVFALCWMPHTVCSVNLVSAVDLAFFYTKQMQTGCCVVVALTSSCLVEL